MPRTRTREIAVLAVTLAFLVLLLGLLVVLTGGAGGAGSPPGDIDTTAVGPREDTPAESIARARVVPLPVPAPADERAPAPAQAVAAATPVPPQQPAVDPGAFPEIIADYRATIGFDAYTRALARIGGRFFVVRKPAFSIVAEVDPVDLDFIDDAGAPMAGLSPRSRDISAEPRLQGLLARAPSRFGADRYGAIVLLPRLIDRRLITTLGEIGQVAGGEIDSFICSYRLSGGALALHVTAIRRKDGRVIPVDRLVRLTPGRLPQEG